MTSGGDLNSIPSIPKGTKLDIDIYDQDVLQDSELYAYEVVKKFFFSRLHIEDILERLDSYGLVLSGVLNEL